MINGVSGSYKSKEISKLSKSKGKKANLKLKKAIKEKSIISKK